LGVSRLFSSGLWAFLGEGSKKNTRKNITPKNLTRSFLVRTEVCFLLAQVLQILLLSRNAQRPDEQSREKIGLDLFYYDFYFITKKNRHDFFAKSFCSF
jgi:hypothetical protein